MTLQLFFKRIVFAVLRPEKAVGHPIDMIKGGLTTKVL